MRVMPKIRRRGYASLFVIFLALAACSAAMDSAREAEFAQFLPGEDVNKSLQMEVIEKDGAFTSEDTIDFLLRNAANEAIVLPHDFGARGFYYEPNSEQWIELKNMMRYSPDTLNLIVPSGGALSDRIIVGFDPDEEGIELPIRLRVLVVGSFYRDNETTDEKVAAFADAMITEE